MDTEKRVTFHNKITVFYYKQTPVETNVCWQQVARDRRRFKRRMLDVEQKIGWVFEIQHRNRVFSLINS
jgi:hypothetical protein